MVDDASKYKWLPLLEAKAEAAEAMKRAMVVAEVQSGHRHHVLRTDNGDEFTSVTFSVHCADYGVTHHFTAPYSHRTVW